MYIIYHDESGTHSSIIAALIHLQLLPEKDCPNKDLLRNIQSFNRKKKNSCGHLIYQGSDEYGNEIYTLGRNSAGPLVTNTIQTITQILDEKSHEVLCIDTSNFNNYQITLGSFCSVKLGLYSLGDYLAVLGVKKAYSGLLKLVKKTKLKIAP